MATGLEPSANSLEARACLTGEPLPQVKSCEKDDYLHADSNVKCGSAHIIVCAVGRDTQSGRIREEMGYKEDAPTPLQKKLDTMAELIGYAGCAAAGKHANNFGRSDLRAL